MWVVIHKNVGFKYETDIEKCNALLLRARDEMPYRFRDGISQLNSYGYSKEYRRYQEKLGMNLFLYGMALFAVILDIIVNPRLTELTGLAIIVSVINSIVALKNLLCLLPKRRWYNENKAEICRAYQQEWEKILEEYYAWCKQHNETPLRNMQYYRFMD